MSNPGLPAPLGLQFPGGCYLGFNAAITTKGVEQLLSMATQAVQQRFQKITLCLSSTGGDPDSALYAFNLLSALPVELCAHNVGAVQSAAVTVFLAAQKRYGSPGTTFFFHQTSFNHEGRRLTEAYVTERVQFIKRHDDKTAQIIANKTGGTVESVNKWQNAEFTMDDKSALKEGFIEAICPLVIPPNAWVSHVIV